jgi:hypothetical protein
MATQTSQVNFMIEHSLVAVRTATYNHFSTKILKNRLDRNRFRHAFSILDETTTGINAGGNRLRGTAAEAGCLTSSWWEWQRCAVEVPDK